VNQKARTEPRNSYNSFSLAFGAQCVDIVPDFLPTKFHPILSARTGLEQGSSWPALGVAPGFSADL
jgi:hypothetical protein